MLSPLKKLDTFTSRCAVVKNRTTNQNSKTIDNNNTNNNIIDAFRKTFESLSSKNNNNISMMNLPADNHLALSSSTNSVRPYDQWQCWANSVNCRKIETRPRNQDSSSSPSRTPARRPRWGFKSTSCDGSYDHNINGDSNSINKKNDNNNDQTPSSPSELCCSLLSEHIDPEHEKHMMLSPSSAGDPINMYGRFNVEKLRIEVFKNIAALKQQQAAEQQAALRHRYRTENMINDSSDFSIGNSSSFFSYALQQQLPQQGQQQHEVLLHQDQCHLTGGNVVARQLKQKGGTLHQQQQQQQQKQREQSNDYASSSVAQHKSPAGTTSHQDLGNAKQHSIGSTNGSTRMSLYNYNHAVLSSTGPLHETGTHLYTERDEGINNRDCASNSIHKVTHRNGDENIRICANDNNSNINNIIINNVNNEDDDDDDDADTNCCLHSGAKWDDNDDDSVSLGAATATTLTRLTDSIELTPSVVLEQQRIWDEIMKNYQAKQELAAACHQQRSPRGEGASASENVAGPKSRGSSPVTQPKRSHPLKSQSPEQQKLVKTTAGNSKAHPKRAPSPSSPPKSPDHPECRNKSSNEDDGERVFQFQGRRMKIITQSKVEQAWSQGAGIAVRCIGCNQKLITAQKVTVVYCPCCGTLASTEAMTTQKS